MPPASSPAGRGEAPRSFHHSRAHQPAFVQGREGEEGGQGALLEGGSSLTVLSSTVHLNHPCLQLHAQGKTDQAKTDLARLAKIRADREAAQAKRKAEAEGLSQVPITHSYSRLTVLLLQSRPPRQRRSVRSRQHESVEERGDGRLYCEVCTSRSTSPTHVPSKCSCQNTRSFWLHIARSHILVVLVLHLLRLGRYHLP